MSEILFPSTVADLSQALTHVLKDFSHKAFNGNNVSAALHPGIYTTQDVLNAFRARTSLQAGMAEALPCPKHRLELHWHTEPLSCLRQTPLQLPENLKRQPHLLRPSFLIRPPCVRH